MKNKYLALFAICQTIATISIFTVFKTDVLWIEFIALCGVSIFITLAALNWNNFLESRKK